MLLKALKCEAKNLQIKLIWFWFISQFNSHPIWNTPYKKDDFNPLHPNISMQVLEFVIINSLFFWPKFVIQGWYYWKK